MTNSAETSCCEGFKSDANVPYIFHPLSPSRKPVDFMRRRSTVSCPARHVCRDELASPQIQADSRGSPGKGVGLLGGGVTKWHQSVTLAHRYRQGDEHLSFQKAGGWIFPPFLNPEK